MSAAAKAFDDTEELSRVVESGDVEAVAGLLPRVTDLNARNRHGTTALMRAASCGHTEMVRLLLKHGADPNLARNDQFTALALAAFFGHTETVKALLEFGAHTEVVTRSGASARTWATARTFAEVARCLEAPNPKATEPKPRVQLRRRLSRKRFFILTVIATFIVIGCGGIGALVLRSSEAHDLSLPPPPPQSPPAASQPLPKVEPPRVESAEVIPPAQPPPEPPPSTNNTLVRPTIKKIAGPLRESKHVTVVSEKPIEEPPAKVQISEPPVVAAKPRIDSPKPATLSPQIMAPTKKAKVIQWP